MTFLMFGENLLGAVVLFVDNLQHLVVDNLRRSLAVWALELILLIVIIADVGQAVAHTGVSHHTEGGLGRALQVVHGTCRNGTDEEVFSGAAT